MPHQRPILTYLVLAVGILALSLSALFVRWADAPGPVTWVYPFDAFHDFATNSPQRLPEAFFHDWFIRCAINNAFPLNTVVSDRELASGKLEKEIVIPSHGSTVAEIPVHADFSGLDNGALERMLRGRQDYRLTGTAVFKAWFGSYRYSFDTSGRKLYKKALEK